MKIDYAHLLVDFSAILASTAFGVAGAPIHAAESDRQPAADHPAPSFEQSAAWRGIRTVCTLAAGIAVIVVLVMERGLGGVLPAAGCGRQCEVEQLSGVRLLQEQVWRPRDETGSVAGETAGRESGEPDEHEGTLSTSWAQPIH